MRATIYLMTAWLIVACSAQGQEFYPPPTDTPEVILQPRLPPPPPPLGTNPPLYEQVPPTFASEPLLARRLIGGKPGWYIDFDMALLFPDLRFRNGGQGLAGNSADFELNPDVAGTFTLGYVFDSPNALFFSYRGFGAVGHPNSGAALDDLGTGLELNDFDWVYQRRFGSDSSRLRFTGELGIRLSALRYDISVHSLIPSTFSPDGFVHSSTCWSNEFVGAGPTVGMGHEFLVRPGLSLFSHSDFGVLFGEQTERTHYRSRVPYVYSTSNSFSDRDSNNIKVLRAQAGLNWMPQRTPRMSFQLGYQFEYWWDVGKFDDGRDDIMLNGLFGRMRFTF